MVGPGDGPVTLMVNGKTLEHYFPRPALGRNIRQPLECVGYEDRMDVVVRVHGGGVSAGPGRGGGARFTLRMPLTPAVVS